MEFFDIQIITFLNQFAQQSWAVDKVIGFFSYNHLMKGGILATLIWWGWFKNDDRQSLNREHVIATLFGSVVSMALARGLALTLPFRFRPLHDPNMNFVLPHGVRETILDGWSAFPSDHSALFFTLAIGLLFISRRVGIFAIIWSTLVISFPRIYLGLHWPTDIIAGAFIGIMIGIAGNTYLVRNKYVQLVKTWSYSKPYFIYPLLFLFTYQIADIFESARNIADAALTFILSVIGGSPVQL